MKAIEKPMKIDPNHPPVGRFAIDLRRATAGGFSTSLSIAFKSSGLNCTSVSKELKTYRASSQLYNLRAPSPHEALHSEHPNGSSGPAAHVLHAVTSHDMRTSLDPRRRLGLRALALALQGTLAGALARALALRPLALRWRARRGRRPRGPGGRLGGLVRVPCLSQAPTKGQSLFRDAQLQEALSVASQVPCA